MLLLSHFSHFFVMPWTVAYQAPMSMGFPRQQYWSGLPCPPPEDLPNPGIKPTYPVSSALQVDSLLESPGKPLPTSISSVQFSRSVVSDCLWSPWIAARQASLSITNCRSSLRLTSIKSVMPFSHLILCRPLLLLSPNPSQHQSLFQWVNSLHEVAKVLEFQL